jgi:hypothetical protein
MEKDNKIEQLAKQVSSINDSLNIEKQNSVSIVKHEFVSKVNNSSSKSSKSEIEDDSEQKYDVDTHDSNNNELYEIRQILSHRIKRNGDREYLIWWKGYPREEATWEPGSSIKSNDYLRRYNHRKTMKEFREGEDEYIDNSDDEANFYQNNFSYKSRRQPSHSQINTHNTNANFKLKSEIKSKLENSSTIKKLKHHDSDDNDSNDSEPSDDSDDSDNEASYARERYNPFQYLIPYLELREKLYPIGKTENQYLYKERYSLLDSEWRMSEVYRFGFLTGFNTHLYSSMFRRYYDCLRISRNLAPIWYPKVRIGSITEDNLPKLIMTYVPEDTIHKGRKIKGDIDLTEKSQTLNTLPVPLRKHPSNWSYYKNIHNPPSFTKIAMEYIDNEIMETHAKQRDALRHLKAKRAAKIHNETIPKLERDNDYDDEISSNNDYRSSNTSLKQEFVKKELKRDDLSGQSLAEQNDMFKFVLGELSIDTRAAVILELNKRKYTSEDNRFADKSILKKPPAPKEPFSGRDITQAPQILNYILVNIAKYDFNVGESFSFIEAALTHDALTWFNHQYSDIFNQPRHQQLYRFVMLFKQQYMNQSMATVYENQLRRLKLLQENVHTVDSHFNLFMKIAGNWRACDYTILDEKLVHMYFSSLPENTQRSLGVATLSTCKTVSEMYNIVKQTAIMVNKQQRVINRDVVNVNSMHMKDSSYNYNSRSNTQYDTENDNYNNDYHTTNDTDSNDSDVEENINSVDEQYNYSYPSDSVINNGLKSQVLMSEKVKLYE